MNKLWFYLLLIMTVLSSCISESVIEDIPKGNDTYLSVTNYGLGYVNTYAGEQNDFIIQSFRILAFDGSGTCVSNALYAGNLNQIIVHPIDAGTYDFVFLANEPDDAGVKGQLTGISAYSDLDDIAFPASAFTSDTLIPMMQVIADIEVLKNGVSKTSGVLNPSPVQLELDRLATRLDVTLKAVEDLTAIFTGVTLTHIPDRVPLTSNYTGTINRNQTRSFTLAAKPGYFSDTTVVETGIVWSKNVNRIILPANVFTPKTDNKAVLFTIDLEGSYDPSCNLKIASNDYTLPWNSKLHLQATAKMPLVVNIEASEWEKSDHDWNVNYRTLNVSQLEANITDYNGVRISFWSNMPRVRILPDVYVGASGTATEPTNKVFNDLAVTGNANATTRFSYNPATGSGYMDILVDTINAIGNYTFRLILSAEEADGSNALQREITVRINQYGQRPVFDSYGNGVVGAFFRNDETGERIISGQHNNGLKWTAWVEGGGDFIILSTTPSFDPDIGTNQPGDPELYPVRINEQKDNSIEGGWSVEGKGRVYFRIGARNINYTGQNRYGKVVVHVEQYGKDGEIYSEEVILYIRQGEDADYIWRPDEADRITDGVIAGELRTGARKFSPYNLTAQAFKNGSSQSSVQLAINGAEMVDYPTQGGAYFQWGIKEDETDFAKYVRRAYHPIVAIDPDEWVQSIFNSSSPLWDPASGYAYKTENELCPPGYYRPSDGFTDKKAFNGNYSVGGSPDPTGNYSAEIVNSTLRVSLFKIPFAGNGYKDGVDPTLTPGKELPGTSGGTYSDGFFDRRPIVTIGNDGGKAVSINNTNIAFTGVLYYNDNTNASVFLPSAGRRISDTREFQYQGVTGFYWSSSTAPWYPLLSYGVWGFESAYWHMQPVTSLGSFGHSLRCVKD